MNDQIKFKEIDGSGLSFASPLQDFISIIFECLAREFFPYYLSNRNTQMESVNVSINLIVACDNVFPYFFRSLSLFTIIFTIVNSFKINEKRYNIRSTRAERNTTVPLRVRKATSKYFGNVYNRFVVIPRGAICVSYRGFRQLLILIRFNTVIVTIFFKRYKHFDYKKDKKITNNYKYH